MDESGYKPEDVDFLIVGTVTGEMQFPSTANFVQATLGLVNATTFDLSAACSGFVYGLELADSLIVSGRAKVCLVVGAEAMSSMTDYTDRSTSVLFGDGAGAAVVDASNDERGLLSIYTGSNGNLHHLLYMDGCGARFPAKNRELDSHHFTLTMAGNEVFKHAVKTMGDAAKKALELAGITTDDIDMLIPHQANIRIIDATAKRLKLPEAKVYKNIDRYGNTSAATIPIALDEAKELGIIKKGDLVICVVFGAGFTWGSCVIQL